MSWRLLLLIGLLVLTCQGMGDYLTLPAEEKGLPLNSAGLFANGGNRKEEGVGLSGGGNKGSREEQKGKESRRYQGKVLYGEPLSWEQVNKIFPKYTTILLTDLETGKQLEVERRGGTYHADIQPVTKADTTVLKEIYGGSWSWRRRAVVAEIGLKRLAASINGMPHGAGKLNNDFPGHFCIHFLGSRVHQSRKVDPAHQMMVWKAAGCPEKPFLEAGPEETINLVLTVLNQKDVALASLGLVCPFGEDLWLATQVWQDRLPSITLKRLTPVKPTGEARGTEKEPEKHNPSGKINTTEQMAQDNPNRRIYEITLTLQYPDGTVRRDKKGQLAVVKDLLREERWFVEGTGLKTLLEQ